MKNQVLKNLTWAYYTLNLIFIFVRLSTDWLLDISLKRAPGLNLEQSSTDI